MYYVYVLKSKIRENWIYVGRSDDLKTRINRHNNGGVKSTKAYRPFVLVYYESYLDKKDASKREIELKKHQYKDILKRQIKNSLYYVCHASRDLA